MKNRIGRRTFLKTASAAGAIAYAFTTEGCTHTPNRDGAGATPNDAGTVLDPSSPGVATGRIPVEARIASDVRVGSADYTPVPDYPIRYQPFTAVTLTDDFWRPKVDRNARVTIPFEIRKRGESSVWGSRGGVFEAAMMALQTHPDPWLEQQVERQIERTLAAQADGPLTSNNGFEVATTLFHLTGRRDLLDPAIQSAGLLYEDFVRNSPPFTGGERDAQNCIRLYKATGEKKHLDLAKHYLDIRGLDDTQGKSRHNQSHIPPVEQREAVGHAVNCVNVMVSLADVGILTGIREYYDAAEAMWHDTVTRKLYVTGGVGSTGNEGFGQPFDLPKISAYAETCAVLMYMTLNHRLFTATGDAKYIDLMERGMYNNALSGIGESGEHYFYVNRLASAGDGRDERWQHASLECCPPNLVRFLARMPQYMYAQGPEEEIYVNLYASSDTSFRVGEWRVDLAVASEMPWGGRTTIRVALREGPAGTSMQDARQDGAIKLRIPGWARNQPVPGTAIYRYESDVDDEVTVSVGGNAVSAVPDAMGYVTLNRTWRDGDVIEVDFPMQVRRVLADERIDAAKGRVAVERGPIVFCAEWPEAPDGRTLTLLLDRDAPLEAVRASDLFPGAMVINTRVRDMLDPSAAARPMRLIPYHLWANRGAGEMSVWLSEKAFEIGDVGPAGGYIVYENENHAADGWRYLEAAPFDQSGGARWGCFRQPTSGADRTGIGMGDLNTREMIAACDEPVTAATLCTTLNLNGVEGWYLPSTDELVAMYDNLHARGIGNWGDAGLKDNVQYWASSQNSTDMAAHVDFADLGRVHGDDKDFPRRVRAIRKI